VQIGIVGLKFTGKTTLHNAITGADAPVGQGGVEPLRAVAPVPDPRLDRLSAMFRPRKTTPAAVEWVDIPGLGAGDGGGGAREGVRFLEHGRRMDALVQVVRCFGGGYGPVDALGEIDTVATELALADLQVVENRLERLVADRRKGNKVTSPLEAPLLERFRVRLERGEPLRAEAISADEFKVIAGYAFLTLKPLIVVLNGPEDGVDAAVAAAARERVGEVVDLCARAEAEIAQLPVEERGEFLADLGIAEPALPRTIRAAYRALGLQSFFTVGEDECRAWTVRQGALAPEAAGVIHSDLERGFIRAEVCAYEELVGAGGLAEAKRANLVRLEGKAYEVRDGDVLNIRFSV
jgi:ribosome-binding ATPase